MRAWGIRTFDNEDALDWLASLDDASDDSVLREALEEVAEAGPADYVESPWGACALAAAEVADSGGMAGPEPSDATYAAMLAICCGVNCEGLRSFSAVARKT